MSYQNNHLRNEVLESYKHAQEQGQKTHQNAQIISVDIPLTISNITSIAMLVFCGVIMPKHVNASNPKKKAKKYLVIPYLLYFSSHKF